MVRGAIAGKMGWCRWLAGAGLLAFCSAVLTPIPASAHEHDSACQGKGKGHGHHRDGSTHCQADNAPPVITFGSPSPGPNAAGWNNTDVSLPFTVTDGEGGSGVASVSPASPLLFTGDGANQSQTVTACDFAGNCATATSPSVSIDKTAPSLAGSASPTPNAAGWNNSPVTVSFSCTDSLSGVASVSAPQTLGEGAGQSASGSCSDNAGNSAETTVSGINIDLTAPTASALRSPDGNANGWNNTDVTAIFSCEDALSGVGSVSPDQVLSSEGAGQSASGNCTDLAGNTSADATVSGINIDKTAPTLSHTDDYAPNGAGWTTADVSVTFDAADALSGVDAGASSGLGTTVLSGEGAGQTAGATAVDLAGNSASDSAGPYNIDKTGPSIAGSADPPANGAGWNNTDVTVSFTCSDDVSGLAAGSPPAPTTLSAEGADQSVSGSCTDLAGHTAEATVSGINIDKTAPSITGAATSDPNANGWYNTAVTVHYDCADDLSGVASAPPDGVIAGPGQGLSDTGTCADNADNSASATVGGINIDLQIPELTGLTLPSLVFFGANFSITASGADPVPGSGFTKAVIAIVEWATSKAFLHNFEQSVTDVWTQRATRLGKFTVKWAGFDGADNDRDPDGEGGVALPDTPGGQSGAFFSPIDNSQYELGRTLPIKYLFVDVDGNPLPEFCLTVVLDQPGGAHQVLSSSYQDGKCQVNAQLDPALGFTEGPVTISLPMDDDEVRGFTRSITLQVK